MTSRLPRLSARVSGISESQTVALTTLMARLVREGRDVVALGAGEPDFPSPDHVNQAAKQAIDDGYTKYTPVAGALDLKEAIADSINTEFGAAYTPDNIVVTCGAKHAVYQAIMAICDPGDEIILPAPYWVSYPEQIKLAGGLVRIVEPAGDDLKITAAQLQQALCTKTKAVILNSPGNPSGAVYSRAELDALAAVIHDAGIYVIADEIYDKICFETRPFASMTSYPALCEQLLYVNGLSKSFSMTGWRIGFLAAPRDVAAAVTRYQGHSTTNATSVAQKAALAAYRGDKSFIADMAATFQQRRDYVIGRLRAIKNLVCPQPQGAFYAFPKIAAYYNSTFGINTSADMCRYLLQDFGVAIVPGAAFGMDKHVRLSYSTSMDILSKALDRIQAGLESLSH